MEGVLPPGYRFYPTEEELISFYLHHKLEGTGGPEVDRVIPVVDIYRHEPWELPMVAAGKKDIAIGGEEEQWFFFTAQQEREARGGKPNRTTATGYWKATGSPGYVYSTSSSSTQKRGTIIGVKKTMVFYMGRAPVGTKTHWKMNEYRAAATAAVHFSDASSSNAPPKLRHEMSVCRVYITSGSSRAFDRRPLFVADAVTTSTTADPTRQPPPPPDHPQQVPFQLLQSDEDPLMTPTTRTTVGDDADEDHQESSNNNDEDDDDEMTMITGGLQPFWEWERVNFP
ncbi:hypothetical protein V2J09_011883 [Rumex salicifolius]